MFASHAERCSQSAFGLLAFVTELFAIGQINWLISNHKDVHSEHLVVPGYGGKK